MKNILIKTFILLISIIIILIIIRPGLFLRIFKNNNQTKITQDLPNIGTIPITEDNSISNNNPKNFTNEDKLIIGVGYMAKDSFIPKLYADAGIKWIKAADLDWSKIEPNAPQNGIHKYDTKIIDQAIQTYQAKGFNIQVVLKSDAPWAVDLGNTNSNTSDFSNLIKSGPPKDEYLDDYASFVKYLVDRYNGDGKNDMPGLLKPIKYYEIESEAQHPFHWQGTIDQYITLLKTAYEAAKSVDPGVKIILSGMNFGDLFDDQPNQELIEKRINSLGPEFKSGVEFVRKTLAAEKYYDLVEFHYNRGVFGAYGTVDYIRQYTNKPIWGGDTSTGPWFFTNFTQPYGNKKTAEELFIKIRDKKEPFYSEYQAEKSYTVIKKFAIAAELGIQRLIYETVNEWSWALNSSKVVDQIWYVMAIANKQGGPYPVYYTLKLLSEKVDDFDSVKKINSPEGVYVYQFTKNNKNTYIAWSENNVNINLNNIIQKTEVTITYPIIDLNQKTPKQELIQTKDLKLNQNPFFIE